MTNFTKCSDSMPESGDKCICKMYKGGLCILTFNIYDNVEDGQICQWDFPSELDFDPIDHFDGEANIIIEWSKLED